MATKPDRQPNTPSGDTFPGHWHFLGAAVFFTVVAVYGSWVPLNYHALDFQVALERFGTIPFLSLGVDSRADFVANILLFIPITFCWLGALTAHRESLLVRLPAAFAVVVLAAAFSVALEFSQLWFPGRTVSQNDVFAETMGGLIGAGLWLAIGDPLVGWLRSVSNERASRGRFDHLLTFYVVGLLIYMVLPLDLTIRPAEIWRQLRDGKIELIPALPSEIDFDTVFAVLRDFSVWIPVGMWSVVWMTPRRRPCRTFLGGMLLSCGLLVATELAQVFVYSRYSSTSDVLLGLMGAAMGAGLMRRWRRDDATEPDDGGQRRQWKALGWFALALLGALAIGLYSCAPFEPILTDRQLIEERLYGMLRVPFAAMYRGSEFNAVGQIVWKGGIFALIGAFLTLGIRQLQLPRGLVRLALFAAVCFAVCLALGIELCQVLLPPHVADITDVLLSSAGAVLGMLTAWRISAAGGKT